MLYVASIGRRRSFTDTCHPKQMTCVVEGWIKKVCSHDLREFDGIEGASRIPRAVPFSIIASVLDVRYGLPFRDPRMHERMNGASDESHRHNKRAAAAAEFARKPQKLLNYFRDVTVSFTLGRASSFSPPPNDPAVASVCTLDNRATASSS